MKTNEENTVDSIYNKWELISLSGEKPLIEKLAYMEFSEEGTVNGYSGCNRFGGSFTITDKDKIEFKQIWTTRMMCPENQMSVEQKFLEMLNSTSRCKITGNQLALYADEESPLAVFQRLVDPDNHRDQPID